MADGTQRASIDGGVGGDVTSFAACGVPPAGALGMFSANDSELLCSASAADVEDAIRAAQEELALEGRRHHQDARSEAKRAELADR
ncbi:hypothetical protein MNEG_11340 [Monoraphidium neglectum]|jgi:hypothetical protein|uniref:Uncharacterized protein n=1 Tax=Monoraphidium neglectum TaxID=145388 RepID=A0A0D2MPP8_9CHLO|nr:hypothetical protein MNEG_11340 [Monoraphidium neglectum]KIY96620.1 hypothetical protein MNEG_11340 [Monoraphidium neglectum]|eukprot:XP_013895640.1 hypothetical protein MNEG_11340 [Monoraphidium neglectum]